MQVWERGKTVGRPAVAGQRGSERGKSDALRSRSGDTAQKLMGTVVVVCNGMLPKELVAPQLRDLPELWFGTTSIPSELIWIEITQ